jgi:hypothetical protein
MTGPLQQHVSRLALVCASIIATTGVCAAVVYLVPRPPAMPLAQANHLLWALVVVTLLNLVTLTPVHRATLAGPLRVYAVSQDLEPLLRAHFAAHVVLFARLEAIAIFGLVLYFLTGRADWFWAFAAIAVAGMLLLWPSQGRVRTALGLS